VKKYIVPSLILIVIIAGIVVMALLFSDKDPLISELAKLNVYSREELSFLKEQGFLDNIDQNSISGNKEEILSLIKASTLVEQNIDNKDESFEVLATKLNKDNYQMAFRLENRSNESRDFYLIPISKTNQTEFKGMNGVLNNKNLFSVNQDDIKNQPLQTLYDVEQHKQQLNPQLAQAYTDIDNNNYQPKPVKITLDANTTLLAKSNWGVKGLTSGAMEPVYLLVYGSAGGAKDGLSTENPDGTKNYKNKWMGSYETICFDTADGDLDKKQYALNEDGTGYYISIKGKDEGQFISVDLSYDVSKLEEVHIVPGAKCYYDEFLTAKGAKAIWKNGEWEMDKMPNDGMVRIKSDSQKYWDTAKIKNHSQPERIEIVDELSPPEPPQPHNEPHSIAFDAVSDSIYRGWVSSFSYSHTCGSSADFLIVGVAFFDNGANDMTSVTYNSESLTQAVIHDFSNTFAAVYYMYAPDTGSAYSIVVTFNDDIAGGGAVASSYSGVNQSDQPDATNSAGGYGSSASVNVETQADNSWVFSAAHMYDSSGSPGCGNTQLALLNSGSYFAGLSDTGGPKTPAGTQQMSWSYLSYGEQVIAAMSFAPATNKAPTITSVSDSPDPVKQGNDVTFFVDWDDTDAEGIKMLVCKTDAITAATPACDGGEWCSNKNDYDLTDPITCDYTTTSSELGSNDYYVFVCDDQPSCSSSSSGTFTVEPLVNPSMKFPGGTNLKGGIILK